MVLAKRWELFNGIHRADKLSFGLYERFILADSLPHYCFYSVILWRRVPVKCFIAQLQCFGCSRKQNCKLAGELSVVLYPGWSIPGIRDITFE